MRRWLKRLFTRRPTENWLYVMFGVEPEQTGPSMDGKPEDPLTWKRFSDRTPEAFWYVAVWPDDETKGWFGGSLDVADRKRIFDEIMGNER